MNDDLYEKFLALKDGEQLSWTSEKGKDHDVWLKILGVSNNGYATHAHGYGGKCEYMITRVRND